jgi:uncharacterized protein (TIGR00730 family)
MHIRKLTMYKSADAFIGKRNYSTQLIRLALPGGFGTFEELFEGTFLNSIEIDSKVITWQQLGIHTKPIGILNTDGYYDHLLAMIKHACEEGFISQELAQKMLVVSSDPEDLLERLLKHNPPKSKIKWMDESQI